tara:strand:- start:121 stop:1449 length:1329 start_codon:yes stop_codon:yes gene_type:complete
MNELPMDKLKGYAETILDEAKKQGATSAEAGVHIQKGLDVGIRMGETETIEYTNDHGLGVTVYFGLRKGSANTSILSSNSIKETVAAACRIAKYTSEDPASGLAEAELMAKNPRDLDLNHPWSINPDEAANLAIECENAANEYDKRINNSEGASCYTNENLFVYGNTHGFLEGYPSTKHGISCAVLAGQDDLMQRDYWYTTDRISSQLQTPKEVGKEAAKRTVARLGSRKIKTTSCPVLFKADIAPSLLRGLFMAINGTAIYRKASFLLNHLDQKIFPDWVDIEENPHELRGMASAFFDNEGVATKKHKIVNKGNLKSYILDSYSGRKLNMKPNGNAGGLRNITIQNTGQSFDDLVRDMGTGLIVTEMMGQGASPVTGDYSRGAAGFWVERGEVAFPVQGVTVAGNLKKMFKGLAAIGRDENIPGSTKTGSWLIDDMTVAGD